MTEYINKSKALHEMWQRLYAIEDKLEKEHGLDVCERHDVQIGFEAGLQTIVNMPTIDIVHCGECKHVDKTICLTSFPEKFICKIDNKSHTVDWFCADGERKSDDWYL